MLNDFSTFCTVFLHIDSVYATTFDIIFILLSDSFNVATYMETIVFLAYIPYQLSEMSLDAMIFDYCKKIISIKYILIHCVKKWGYRMGLLNEKLLVASST